MKFGLGVPLAKIHPKGEFQSGATVRQIAQTLEQHGIDAALLSEHPAPSADWLHNDPTGHDCLDPFTALAFVAAATTRLKVLTNVVILPYRNPFLAAKAAATLQILSDNRLLFGVGVGYQKVEFDALGVPFKERGALMDEALETIRQAWAGGAVVKRGKHFDAIGNEARPIPSPAPPIWVGGGSDKAVERAARWGDGWIPYFSVATNDPSVMQAAVTSMEHFAEKVSRLHELRAKLGKTGPFDLSVGAPHRPKTTTRDDAEKLLAEARALEKLGVTWFWLPLPARSLSAYLETVAWFAEEVIAPFKKGA